MINQKLQKVYDKMNSIGIDFNENKIQPKKLYQKYSSTKDNPEVEQIINYIKSNISEIHSDMTFSSFLPTMFYLCNFGNKNYRNICLNETGNYTTLYISFDFKSYYLECSAKQYNELVELLQPILDRDYEYYINKKKNETIDSSGSIINDFLPKQKGHLRLVE